MAGFKLDPEVEFYFATEIVDRDDCGNYIYKNTRGKWKTLNLHPLGNGYYEVKAVTKQYGRIRTTLHRLIFMRAYRKMIPKGWVIHHLDGNHENNHYTNLIAVPDDIHMAYHRTYMAAKTNPLHHIQKTAKGWRVHFDLYGFDVFKKTVHKTLEEAIKDRNNRMRKLDKIFASYALIIPEYYT